MTCKAKHKIELEDFIKELEYGFSATPEEKFRRHLIKGTLTKGNDGN